MLEFCNRPNGSYGSIPVTYGVATKRAILSTKSDDIDSVESTCRKTKIALNRRETLLGQGILRYSELSDRDANRTNLEGGVSRLGVGPTSEHRFGRIR